ncbi:MAG: hypothetical protein EOM37_03465 [Proteobacteria bacterium]|nr:hypothetical protein [Alphaproteobacteria bacterium]NCC03096.1 hypothetical protein [Pseudomonadota bacterium]
MVLFKDVLKPLSFVSMVLIVSAVLGACTGSYHKRDSYVAKSGAVVNLETDKQSCQATCDSEYDRCMETGAAQSPVGRGQMTGVLGAQADCSASMRSCQNRCRIR